MVALIPARADSKRVPNKNTRLFAGKSLTAYAIESALASGAFEDVQVWTDDPHYLRLVVGQYGVALRGREYSADDEPDIAWVRLWAAQTNAASFAILRPTSPFRTAETIRRAYQQFGSAGADSLRAVEPVSQHPGKMWAVTGDRMTPLLGYQRSDGVPWHSCPTQTLPTFYVQNASLEMAWTRVVRETGTIAGKIVTPFFTEGYEGFDINTEDDWARAERLIASGAAVLPSVTVAGLPQTAPA